MESTVVRYRERLLQIAERKCKLLKSVIEHLDHIEDNPVFVEEIEEAFFELDTDEADIMGIKEITTECPSCGFECNQIHTYCMACGNKLPSQCTTLNS